MPLILFSIESQLHVNTWANSECVLVNSNCGFDAYTIVKHSISLCTRFPLCTIFILYGFPQRPFFLKSNLKGRIRDHRLTSSLYFERCRRSRKVIL